MFKKSAIALSLLVFLTACMQPTPQQRAQQEAHLEAAHAFQGSR